MALPPSVFLLATARRPQLLPHLASPYEGEGCGARCYRLRSSSSPRLGDLSCSLTLPLPTRERDVERGPTAFGLSARHGSVSNRLFYRVLLCACALLGDQHLLDLSCSLALPLPTRERNVERGPTAFGLSARHGSVSNRLFYRVLLCACALLGDQHLLDLSCSPLSISPRRGERGGLQRRTTAFGLLPRHGSATSVAPLSGSPPQGERGGPSSVRERGSSIPGPRLFAPSSLLPEPCSRLFAPSSFAPRYVLQALCSLLAVPLPSPPRKWEGAGSLFSCRKGEGAGSLFSCRTEKARGSVPIFPERKWGQTPRGEKWGQTPDFSGWVSARGPGRTDRLDGRNAVHRENSRSVVVILRITPGRASIGKSGDSRQFTDYRAVAEQSGALASALHGETHLPTSNDPPPSPGAPPGPHQLLRRHAGGMRNGRPPEPDLHSEKCQVATATRCGGLGRLTYRKTPSGKKETVEMERYWIRVAAAAAIVAGASSPQATAQFAPYRLAQQQSAAAARERRSPRKPRRRGNAADVRPVSSASVSAAGGHALATNGWRRYSAAVSRCVKLPAGAVPLSDGDLSADGGRLPDDARHTANHAHLSGSHVSAISGNVHTGRHAVYAIDAVHTGNHSVCALRTLCNVRGRRAAGGGIAAGQWRQRNAAPAEPQRRTDERPVSQWLRR